MHHSPAFSAQSSFEAAIPDPGAEGTFAASKLDWAEIAVAGHAEWHTLYSDLLQLRRLQVVPHLSENRRGGKFSLGGDAALAVDWDLGDGAVLHLRANISPRNGVAASPAPGERIFGLGDVTPAGELDAWGAYWSLGARRA